MGAPSSWSTSPSPATPAEPRWDDTPSWEPLSRDVGLDPSTITIDSSGVHYGERQAGVYEAPPPEIDYSRFREPPPPLPVPAVDHAKRRTLLIGVVGVVALFFGAQVVGRQLDIIGPGAERHCTVTTKPFEGGEGMVGLVGEGSCGQRHGVVVAQLPVPAHEGGDGIDRVEINRDGGGWRRRGARQQAQPSSNGVPGAGRTRAKFGVRHGVVGESVGFGSLVSRSATRKGQVECDRSPISPARRPRRR